MVEARATGSRKYIGRCHALKGQIALGARDFVAATAELTEAVRITQAIEYRPLCWQAAHLLARAHAGADRPEAAAQAARLALDTLDALSARVPDGASRDTFEAWTRVQAAREDLARLVR
jgi:hypothetical protein